MVGVIEQTDTALQLQTVTTFDQFVALEAEWNDAVARAGLGLPFLTHEWLRTWWECFAGDAEMRVIVLRRGEACLAPTAADKQPIIAIAPFLLERTKMYGIPVRRLRVWQNDHTQRTDFIVAERHDQAYRAIWAAVDACRGEWDILQLSQFVRDSPALTAFARLAAEQGLATGTWESGASPYLELAGTWDEYLAGLGSKFRSNVRNRLTRLTQIGPPALEILADGEAIVAARGDSIRLEASGWKVEEGTAITSDPAVQQFYGRLAERASAAGWLRLLFLTVNGARIATSYSATYGGRLFLFKTGYDPGFAKCSPFKVLTYFAVNHAYEQGMREVDFLGDTEPWKLEWTSTTRTHDWLFIFADTLKAKLVYRAKFQVAPAVRQWRA
jgi:CelD/BcsL family acetyltransferase involved in cellulose biosynthesis